MNSLRKTLHIFNFEEKFSKPFFEFLQEHEFDLSRHQLFHYGKHNSSYKTFGMTFNFAKYYSIFKHIGLLRDMFKAKKIIVHSLASPWLLLFLFCFPFLTKKVYWVIWGKDLYFYQLLKKKRFYHLIYEFFRKKVFKGIKHVVTGVPGDALLAQQWYDVSATCHVCMMYPNNLYKHTAIPETNHSGINILLGNSADPSNNHFQLLQKLKPFIKENIKIYAPLSYGDMNNKTAVIKEGKRIFGDKFIPLTKLREIKQYHSLLSKIDFAVFGHKRQQAMGNTITLLGLGKKVFMDRETTSWLLFKEANIQVFNNDQIDLNKLSSQISDKNIKQVKNYFSEKKYLSQLKLLFG